MGDGGAEDGTGETGEDTKDDGDRKDKEHVQEGLVADVKDGKNDSNIEQAPEDAEGRGEGGLHEPAEDELLEQAGEDDEDKGGEPELLPGEGSREGLGGEDEIFQEAQANAEKAEKELQEPQAPGEPDAELGETGIADDQENGHEEGHTDDEIPVHGGHVLEREGETDEADERGEGEGEIETLLLAGGGEGGMHEEGGEEQAMEGEAVGGEGQEDAEDLGNGDEEEVNEGDETQAAGTSGLCGARFGKVAIDDRGGLGQGAALAEDFGEPGLDLERRLIGGGELEGFLKTLPGVLGIFGGPALQQPMTEIVIISNQ